MKGLCLWAGVNSERVLSLSVQWTWFNVGGVELGKVTGPLQRHRDTVPEKMVN